MKVPVEHQMNSALEDTLAFARANQISVIPIRYKDKSPAVAEWKPYKTRCATEEEIQQWFFGRKKHNIALVAGRVSGGDGRASVFIDVDDTDIYNALFPNAPETRIVKTSRGYHVYFFTPEPIPIIHIVIEKNGETTNVDVQGEGAYILAPPSVHPSGTIYKWLNDLPIKFLEGETPAHFKQHLIHRIDEICKQNGWKRKGAAENDIKRIIHGVGSGERNTSAYILASYYKQSGRTQIETEDLLEEWNERCDPPLPQTELVSVVASAFKPDAKTGFNFGLGDDTGESRFFTDKGKPKIKEISEDIKSRHIFICIKDTEDLYRYNPKRGIYEHGGETIIKSECKSNYCIVLNRYWVREILDYIQATSYFERNELNSNPNLIHLTNGIYNLRNDTFMDFTPDIKATVRIPVVYDPNATCPRFDKFLDEIFKGDKDPERKKQFIWETLADCLLKGVKFHIIIIFIGGGGNGKTVLIETINALLGPENICNTSLQAFQKDKWAPARLYGKLANTYADISSKAIGDTGLIKMLSGEDTIDADIKYSVKPIKFRNYATMIFSTNTPPLINDDTWAWWRRFRSINFNRKFEGQNDDKMLKLKLRSPEELSGIFNKAVKTLRELLKRGEFTELESAKERRYEYLRRSNSPLAFREECIEEDYDSYVFKDEYYTQYRDFCIEHHLRLESRKIVSERLPEYANVTVQKKTDDNGNRREAWVNIRFKDEAEIREVEKKMGQMKLERDQ